MNQLVRTSASDRDHLCPHCRVLRGRGGACEICGAEAALALAPAAERALADAPAWPRSSARERVVAFLVGVPLAAALLVAVGLVLFGSWPHVLVGLILALPGYASIGLLWNAVTGRRDGLTPFASMTTVAARRLEARRMRSRGRLLLAAHVDPERARTGAIDAPRGEVVARLEAWFLPRGRAPFAWQASTGGFAIVLDDGTEVEVPPGLLRIDVPSGHARRLRRRAVGRGGPRGYLVAVELRGGQRVRLDAELQAAAPAALGYREPVRRFVTRGRPTLELLPRDA